jgi:hypothetical protein
MHSNDILWTLPYKKILYFQHQIKMPLLNVKKLNINYICCGSCECDYTHHSYVGKIIGYEIFWHYDGSFDSSLGHFTWSLKGISFPSMVWLVALTLLGCWTLIAPTLVIHFQHDDHLILFDVVARVKTDIFSFQLVLWDTQILLPQVVCF